MDKQQIDDAAFSMFANVYPHEAYEAYPERFVEFVQGAFPSLSEAEIVQLLNETKAAEAAGGKSWRKPTPDGSKKSCGVGHSRP